MPGSQASDLSVVSFTSAKSIIILTSDHDMQAGTTPDVADSKNLRVLLAVLSCRKELSGHVVVELCDIDNMKHVKLIGGQCVEVTRTSAPAPKPFRWSGLL